MVFPCRVAQSLILSICSLVIIDEFNTSPAAVIQFPFFVDFDFVYFIMLYVCDESILPFDICAITGTRFAQVAV